MTDLLRAPSRDLLPAYVEALETGWSPNNVRPEAAQEQLKAIAEDAEAFLASLVDPEAKGPAVKMADGSFVARLPSLRWWIWSDGFAGSIGLRWKPGTNALPPTALGHAGYAIVPWRRGEGLATAALRALLPEARARGLDWLDVTADPDNTASIRVIEKAGGTLLEEMTRPEAQGGGRDLLFRLTLPAKAP
ncbi:MAG: GNAT family N-acetyltransferase [Pseudomonadota bacterium]